MKHSWLKGALVGAAVIFGANGSFAANEWSYADGKITKGGWTIAATYTEGESTITLGAIEDAAEDGVLDLRDMVVGGTAITGLTMPGSQAWKSAAVTNFYANNVAGKYVPSMLRGNTGLQVFELGSETIEQIRGGDWSLRGCSALGKVVFKCPNLLYWNQNSSGCPIEGVVSNAFHDMVNPGVTNVGTKMLANFKKMTGDMILTNLQFIGSAFYAGDANGSFQATNIWIRTSQKTGFHMQPGFVTKKLKIEAPNLEQLWMLEGFNQVEGDIADMVPRQIQEFCRSSLSFPKVTGTLVVTNLTKFRSDVGFSYVNYVMSLPKVNEMELRGPIDVITFPVFASGTAMNRLVLDFPKMTNMYVGAFRMRNNGSLYIYGKPFPHEMMTNLLARVDGNGATGLTMYCSKKQKRDRSEERRVGKECRSRWSPYH